MAVDTALITQFNNLLHVEAQQMNTRFMGKFDIKPVSGDDWAYDGTSIVEAKTVNSRNPKIDPVNPNFTRRQLTRERILVELIVDNRDVRGMFEDPKSKLVRDCMYAINRKADRVGIANAFASVNTGQDFGTALTFAAGGGTTVDATAALTYAKMLEIKDTFSKYEVGLDTPEQIWLFLTEQEESQLMKISQLTSGDFSRQYVVEQGTIVKALGMNIACFGSGVDLPQLSVTAGTRDCIACSTMGMIYGMSENFKVRVIEDHPDYVESTYISVLGEIGAVRTDEKRMVKFQTTAV